MTAPEYNEAEDQDFSPFPTEAEELEINKTAARLIDRDTVHLPFQGRMILLKFGGDSITLDSIPENAGIIEVHNAICQEFEEIPVTDGIPPANGGCYCSNTEITDLVFPEENDLFNIMVTAETIQAALTWCKENEGKEVPVSGFFSHDEAEKIGELQQTYDCSHGISEPDELWVKIINIATGEVKEQTIIIADPVLLSLTNDIIGFPLEELEYGLYRDDITAQEVIDDALSQAMGQMKIERPLNEDGSVVH